MAGLSNEAPEVRRIIKKVKGHEAHHGGAWKVAYADFVTAMMALFIVLWIMSQSQSLRENVAQYFKNPGVLSGSKSVLEKSNLGGAIPTPGYSQELQKPPPAPEEMAEDQIDAMDKKLFEAAEDRARLEEMKKHLQEIIAQLPELKKMADQIRVEMTAEGLRIDLMEKENSNFFDVGSANMKSPARELFNLISRELGHLPNPLTLEGHTDARPYGSQNYTNWELSADRANAARRLMESSGLRPNQVSEVRGYADRHLFDPKDPNDFRNRRVSIVVNYLDKSNPTPFALPPSLDFKKRSTAVPAEKVVPSKVALPSPLPPAPSPLGSGKGQEVNGTIGGTLVSPPAARTQGSSPGPAPAETLPAPPGAPAASAMAPPIPDKVGLPIFDISPKLDLEPIKP